MDIIEFLVVLKSGAEEMSTVLKAVPALPTLTPSHLLVFQVMWQIGHRCFSVSLPNPIKMKVKE